MKTNDWRLGKRLQLLIVFSFAIGIALLFWYVGGGAFSPQTSDYICCYAPMAQTLLNGQLPDMQSAVLPIGYSVLLAPWFFGAQLLNVPLEWGAAGLTLLCYSLSSVVVFALAELFWEWKHALTAALIWACLLPVLWLTRGQNSEISFILFSGAPRGPMKNLRGTIFWRAFSSVSPC